MNAPETIARDGLESIGLGPQRIKTAFDGAALFGPAGLLNSLELVQFIAALSDRTQIDALEFLETTEVIAGAVFSNIDTLCRFLSGRLIAVERV